MKSSYVSNSKISSTPLRTNNQARNLSNIKKNNSKKSDDVNEDIIEELEASIDTSSSACELILKKVANLKPE